MNQDDEGALHEWLHDGNWVYDEGNAYVVWEAACAYMYQKLKDDMEANDDDDPRS